MTLGRTKTKTTAKRKGKGGGRRKVDVEEEDVEMELEEKVAKEEAENREEAAAESEEEEEVDEEEEETKPSRKRKLAKKKSKVAAGKAKQKASKAAVVATTTTPQQQQPTSAASLLLAPRSPPAASPVVASTSSTQIAWNPNPFSFGQSNQHPVKPKPPLANCALATYFSVKSSVTKLPHELRPPLAQSIVLKTDAEELTPEQTSLVEELFKALQEFKEQLGGVRKDRKKWELDENGNPKVLRKLTRRELAEAYTDYEYIHLQIVGFVSIEKNKKLIVEKNNHKFFTNNPGVQFMERIAGITMHGDRPESNSMAESALSVLLNAFRFAKAENNLRNFFCKAFDRSADPCLEGRIGRLQEFIERSASYWKGEGEGAADGEATEVLVHWRDLNLVFEDRTIADPIAALAEFLRVYINNAKFQFSKKTGRSYDEISEDFARNRDNIKEMFEELCTVEGFKTYLAEQGVVGSDQPKKPGRGGRGGKAPQAQPPAAAAAADAPAKAGGCPFTFAPSQVDVFVNDMAEAMLTL